MPFLQPPALWQAVLGELQVEVARASYETFLKDTRGAACEDHRLTVVTPSPFAAEYLQQKLYPLVKRTVAKVAKEPLEVRFSVAANESSTVGVSAAQVPHESNGAHRQHGLPPPALPLNARYTFQTFVVGKSNHFAHAAAVAAAEYSGQKYNPVFIISGVGLGKTHLLHAVAHRVMQRGGSVIYTSAEQFTNEFVTAIREGRVQEFNAKFTGPDVLLMDDVYAFSGKEQTQERFFHIFNELHQSGKQIVLTSDRTPMELTSLVERLRSRFGMGLIGDIQTPDLETRLAILRSKAEQRGAPVPDEVLALLARRVQRSVRDLEGTLNRVLAVAEMTNAPVTKELAANALEGLAARHERQVTAPGDLVALVGKHYRLPPDMLRGPSREKKIALGRHVAMLLLHQELGLTLSEVGRVMGGRDHSTVDHACKKVERYANADAVLRADLVSLREALQRPG